MYILNSIRINKYILFTIIIYLFYKYFKSIKLSQEGVKNKTNNGKKRKKRSGKKRKKRSGKKRKKRSGKKRSGKKRKKRSGKKRKKRNGKCSKQSILKKCKRKKKNRKQMCIIDNKIKCNKIKCNLGTPDKTKSLDIMCSLDTAKKNISFDDKESVLTRDYYNLDVYNDKSNTSFVDSSENFIYLGQLRKAIFDRRTINTRHNINTHVFFITFGKKSKKIIEAIVNSSDYDKHNATTIVKKYARMIGRVPGFLLCGLKSIHINKGGTENKPLHWGAIPNEKTILIHSDMDAVYNKSFNIYDVVIHELTHASIDDIHLDVSGWNTAIRKDCIYYSDYAKDNPEDLALIMPKYISYSLKKAENKIAQIESLPPSLEKIAEVFSARFNYLDKLNLNLDILE